MCNHRVYQLLKWGRLCSGHRDCNGLTWMDMGHPPFERVTFASSQLQQRPPIDIDATLNLNSEQFLLVYLWKVKSGTSVCPIDMRHGGTSTGRVQT